MHWLGGSSAWLSMAPNSRSNACCACGWMNSSCGKVILNVSMWLPWLPGSTLTISPKKLPGRDMTSIPIPFYWPNGWSRTSREQPGAPLLSVSGSVTRMNRWTKSANSSDPGERPIDSEFPFCSPSAVRRPHPCLGRAIATCGGDVGARSCQAPDSSRRRAACLPNDLISTSQEHRRKLQFERLCCSHVHHELEFCWLLNRKITRFDALQDLFDLARGTPVEIVKTCSIRHQTARIHHFP